MSFLPPAIFEIKAVADKAIAEFKQVNNELGKMEGQAQKAGGSIGGVDKASRIATAGLLAMGAAFAGFAALGIKEAMEAETIMTKLNATLSAQGLNTAKTRKEIDELSGSFVQLGFDDEAAASSMQILIQTTGDLTKSKNLLGMAADLARAKTISLEAASQMLVRANMGAGKVFKQFGIVLDTTLPKAEATAKAMQELKEKLSGQAQKATETFAVQLQILKERFNNAAQAVGEVLIPYLKTLFDKINQGIEFVKRNSTAFQIFGGIVLVVTIALASYAVTLKVITAATKAYAFIQGVAKTATMLLTGQQIALNGAMAVNPIGLVVMAVVALIGVLVILWNKSDTFRKGVIAMAKAALNAFASIIPMLGQVGEAYLKFLLTPMKLFLGALSHLPKVGKYAKAGLDILTKGLDGVSDFADKAAAKAKTLAAGLDKLNKPIKIKFLETPDVDFGNSVKGKGKGLTPEQIATQKAAKEAQTKANEDYMKIVGDLNDKIVSAQTKFTKKMTDIDKTYKEKISNAQTDFNEKMGELNARRSEDLLKAEKDNATKVSEIYKSYYAKIESIVKQSVDRLRDAFRKGTEFNPVELFKGLSEAGATNIDALLASMKEKLAASKELAKNAAALQAKGFSQTFIEQVVAAGPEVGNQLSKSILDSTPAQIKELQDSYAEMEKTSQHGVDGLANQMSRFGKLATEELNDAYAQAGIDLAESLANQAQAFIDAQTEINNNFDKAMAEAEKIRDSAISEAYKDMVDAQEEARKELASTLADIEKDMVEKLGSITNATKATIAAIQALAAAMSGAKASAQPIIPAQSDSVASYTMADALKKTGAASEAEYLRESGGGNITVKQTNNFNGQTSAAEVTSATVSAIKFGSVGSIGQRYAQSRAFE
jgi:hypothetical protein